MTTRTMDFENFSDALGSPSLLKQYYIQNSETTIDHFLDAYMTNEHVNPKPLLDLLKHDIDKFIDGDDLRRLFWLRHGTCSDNHTAINRLLRLLLGLTKVGLQDAIEPLAGFLKSVNNYRHCSWDTIVNSLIMEAAKLHNMDLLEVLLHKKLYSIPMSYIDRIAILNEIHDDYTCTELIMNNEHFKSMSHHYLFRTSNLYAIDIKLTQDPSMLSLIERHDPELLMKLQALRSEDELRYI